MIACAVKSKSSDSNNFVHVCDKSLGSSNSKQIIDNDGYRKPNDKLVYVPAQRGTGLYRRNRQGDLPNVRIVASFDKLREVRSKFRTCAIARQRSRPWVVEKCPIKIYPWTEATYVNLQSPSNPSLVNFAKLNGLIEGFTIFPTRPGFPGFTEFAQRDQTVKVAGITAG